MPNYVENHLYFEGDNEKITRLMETVKNDEFGVGTIDFNKIIPMPIELEIESGSRTYEGIKKYGKFLSDYFFPGGFAETYFMIPASEGEKRFQEAHPEIDQEVFQLGKQALCNYLQYGYVTWYSWRNYYWNTKWNACGYRSDCNYSDSNHIWFQTAWDEPTPVIEKLSEMFPEITITHEFANEDFGMHCGKTIYLAGKVIDQYCPTEDAEICSFAMHVWGISDKENESKSAEKK